MQMSNFTRTAAISRFFRRPPLGGEAPRDAQTALNVGTVFAPLVAPGEQEPRLRPAPPPTRLSHNTSTHTRTHVTPNHGHLQSRDVVRAEEESRQGPGKHPQSGEPWIPTSLRLGAPAEQGSGRKQHTLLKHLLATHAHI